MEFDFSVASSLQQQPLEDVCKAYLKSLRLPLKVGLTAKDLGMSDSGFEQYCQCNGVITLLSDDIQNADIIHLSKLYESAEDLEASVSDAMCQLSLNGVLAVSLLVEEKNCQTSSYEDSFIPTFSEVSSAFKAYAWKLVGKHDDYLQGANCQRMVFHVRHFKPMVFLLIGNPGSGKSSISNRFFKQQRVVHGDDCYKKMFDGEIKISDSLFHVIRNCFSPSKVQHMTSVIFIKELSQDLVEAWISIAGGANFVLDSYVPELYRDEVKQCFEKNGYIAVELNWYIGYELPSLKEAETMLDNYLTPKISTLVKCCSFLERVKKLFNINKSS